jgi:hypothetical protein
VLNHKEGYTYYVFSHSLALSDSFAGSVSASKQAKGDGGDALQPLLQEMKAVEEKDEHALNGTPNSLVESGFSVGTILEAEMMDPRYPNYTDTIHPVEVVAIQEDGVFLCRMLAFEAEDTDTWTVDLLHLPMEPEEHLTWNQADRVHFRCRNRKSRNKM